MYSFGAGILFPSISRENRKVCEKVSKTWRDLNSARAHIKFAEAFLDEHDCNPVTALDHMDVTPEEIYNTHYLSDE